VFNTDRLHLDHDPPLALRQFDKLTGKYLPDANDPEYLRYIPADQHRIKTFVRGEHGQRSDTAQIKRNRRRLKPRKPKGRPMPGTKASGISKRMDGTVVRRQP